MESTLEPDTENCPPAKRQKLEAIPINSSTTEDDEKTKEDSFSNGAAEVKSSTTNEEKTSEEQLVDNVKAKPHDDGIDSPSDSSSHLISEAADDEITKEDEKTKVHKSSNEKEEFPKGSSSPSKKKGGGDANKLTVPAKSTSPKKKSKKKKKLKPTELKKEVEPSVKQKAANLRKNIKDILKTESLGEETLAAQREEAERRERMNLKLQQLKLLQAQAAAAAAIAPVVDLIGATTDTGPTLSGTSREEPQGPDQSLLGNTSVFVEQSPAIKTPDVFQKNASVQEEEIILLSDDEDSTPKPFPSAPEKSSELRSHLMAPQAQHQFHNFKSIYGHSVLVNTRSKDRSEENVISISSGEEDNACDNEVSSLNGNAYHPPNFLSTAASTSRKLGGDSDDDCVVVSPTPDKDDGDKDERNIDEFNVLDEFGRVLVNVGHPDEDPDIYLAPQVARIVKSHQIGGIRFLYDNVVESVERFNTASGFGCILAHSMGLGKTLQAVSFCDVFLRASSAKTVLIIVPINTVQNWLNEFNVWLPSKKSEGSKKSKAKKETTAKNNVQNSPLPPPQSQSPSQSSLNDCISETVSLNLSFDSTLNLFDDGVDHVPSTPENNNESSCSKSKTDQTDDGGEVHYRTFDVYVLNETVKTLQAREKIIANWSTKGGVMLIGYEMYRMLALKKLKKSTKKQPDYDFNGDSNEALSLNHIHSCLVDPGPDLVICDEGHRIKNSGASISQALKAIRTKRRVVLTGYPLQNNLMEYWCMVDFIRPNYLGSKVEFSNMFERPISNGQCVDSTPEDRRLMKFRSHVLHSLLEGFVQRRSHAVLHHALPQKQEWVFLLKMTPIQYKLYKEFMQYLSDNTDGQVGANPIKAFAVCCKIWNHPDALYNVVKKKQSILDDLDLDEINGGSNDSKSKNSGARGRKDKKDLSQISFFDGSGFNFPKNHFGSYGSSSYRSGSEALSLDWALPIFENYEPGILENGVKFEILFEIIKESVAANDKLLIFSQTLLSLDLVEGFFQQRFNWNKNGQYYRLDGSTTGLEREKLINNFNSKKEIFVFLVSTRAGSLGINLTGANRVVVLDASWNPCHDCQAVCRIYRYGQTKPCQIYRFVSDCTLEKRIYDRQINKRGMSDRVVDEMNPNAQFKTKDVSSFLVLKHDLLDKLQYTKCDINPHKFSDPILQNVLISHGDKLTQEPFEHESLLIDQKSQRLSATEKRLAHRNYLSEKRTAELQTASGFSYSRPSYAAYYPRESSSSSSQSQTTQQRYSSSSSSMPNFRNFPVPHEDKFEQHVPALRLKGICVQSIVLKKDSFLADPSGGPDMYLMAGEKIYVLRSEKGTYLRISNGKLIAVRNNASNTRYPILNIPPNQELPKEQLQTLVYSFLTVPGYRGQPSNNEYNSGTGQSYNPYSHPMEQPLPPSASFFSQSKNHLQITNPVNNSGGDVTMWQPPSNLAASNNSSRSSSSSTKGFKNTEYSKPQSLSALLDSNSGNPSNFNDSLDKLSYLANRFSSLSSQPRNESEVHERRNSFGEQSSGAFQFSQYPNLTVQFPTTPVIQSTSSDIELIPIQKPNNRGGSVSSSSSSNHGFPYSPSSTKSHSENNNGSHRHRHHHRTKGSKNPPFYEDFTITVKSPKGPAVHSSNSNGSFSPQFFPQINFDRGGGGEPQSQKLSHSHPSSNSNENSVGELDFRNLSQYYNNGLVHSSSVSSAKNESVPTPPYFPDHSV